MTIAGGTHYEPYRDEVHPADETVAATTTRFWDHYLNGAPVAGLLTAAAVEGMSTLEHDL